MTIKLSNKDLYLYSFYQALPIIVNIYKVEGMIEQIII